MFDCTVIMLQVATNIIFCSAATGPLWFGAEVIFDVLCA